MAFYLLIDQFRRPNEGFFWVIYLNIWTISRFGITMWHIWGTCGADGLLVESLSLVDGYEALLMFAVLSHFLQKISWYLLSTVLNDNSGYYLTFTSGLLIAVPLNKKRPCYHTIKCSMVQLTAQCSYCMWILSSQVGHTYCHILKFYFRPLLLMS